MPKPVHTTSLQASQTTTTGAIPVAPILDLPKDVTTLLFRLMIPSDLAVCSGVCKQWHKVAQNNRLWTLLLERDFPHLSKEDEAKKAKEAKQVYQNKYRFSTNLSKGMYTSTTMRSPEHSGAVASLILTKERQLISGSWDDLIEIWELSSSERVNIFQGHIRGVKSLVLTEEGQLISGAQDGTIKVWDLKSEKTDKCVNTFQSHAKISSLILTKKGQLITGSSGGAIKILDLKSEKADKCVNTLQGQSTSAVFSFILTEEEQLISGFYDGTIEIWDLRINKSVKILKGHTGIISSLILTEKKQLISSSHDHAIKIWDLDEGKCVKTLQKAHFVKSLVLTEEGWLISGARDGTIEIWDLENDKHVTTLQGHSGAVSRLLLTKKGQLISSSFDRTIKIWDFAASNKAIFQELAEKFKEETSTAEEYKMLLERFLKMPLKERGKIYMEFCALFSNFSFETAKHAFYVIHELPGENLGQKRAQAINNYLKKLPNIPVDANLNTSPVEEIVEMPTEELNEVFQYFTDILQITDKQKIIFQKSEFSAAFVKKTGLVSFVDLQAIGINPQLMEKLAQLQGQLKQLFQEGKLEQTHKHQALATITSIKDSIESLLKNLLPIIDLGKEAAIPLDRLIDMQSFLIKQNALLGQVSISPQYCNQFINSGDLLKFANSLLAVVAQFEQCIKQSQIELLNAYLSQPHLNATWENLQANGITKASQLTQAPSEFYQLRQ